MHLSIVTYKRAGSCVVKRTWWSIFSTSRGIFAQKGICTSMQNALIPNSNLQSLRPVFKVVDYSLDTRSSCLWNTPEYVHFFGYYPRIITQGSPTYALSSSPLSLINHHKSDLYIICEVDTVTTTALSPRELIHPMWWATTQLWMASIHRERDIDCSDFYRFHYH
jgi:hypothetical protein